MVCCLLLPVIIWCDVLSLLQCVIAPLSQTNVALFATLHHLCLSFFDWHSHHDNLFTSHASCTVLSVWKWHHSPWWGRGSPLSNALRSCHRHPPYPSSRSHLPHLSGLPPAPPRAGNCEGLWQLFVDTKRTQVRLHSHVPVKQVDFRHCKNSVRRNLYLNLNKSK